MSASARRKKNAAKKTTSTATSTTATVSQPNAQTAAFLASAISAIEAKKTPSIAPVTQTARITRFINMSKKYFDKDFNGLFDCSNPEDHKEIFFILVNAATFRAQGIVGTAFDSLNEACKDNNFICWEIKAGILVVLYKLTLEVPILKEKRAQCKKELEDFWPDFALEHPDFAKLTSKALIEHTIGTALQKLKTPSLETIGRHWLMEAEKTGCFNATISLAMIDFDKFNDEKKLLSFKLPANKKHPMVLFRLGTVYTGLSTVEKKQEGWSYLKTAADAGHAEAQFCVGNIYASKYVLYGLQAVEQLPEAELKERAVDYLNKSLKLKNSAAQFDFAKSVALQARVTSKDLNDSYGILIKCGIDNNHTLARQVLGLMIIKSFVARGLIKDQAIVTDSCNDIAAVLIKDPDIKKSYEKKYPDLKDLETAKTFFPNTEWFKLPDSEALHQFIDEQKNKC